MLLLAGLAALGLWWWRTHPEGFNLPSLTGAPAAPPTASATPGAPPDAATPPATPEDPTEESPPPTAQQPTPEQDPPVADPSPTGTPDENPDQVEWGPSQQKPAHADTVLFEDRGDLDGDGQEETVQIVAVDGNPNCTTRTPRKLQILRLDGTTAFQTDSFTEPFLPDLDHLADRPWNRAGVHVVAGKSRYPEVRLVFASASGNYVVFRYDGQTWQVVDAGG